MKPIQYKALERLRLLDLDKIVIKEPSALIGKKFKECFPEAKNPLQYRLLLKSFYDARERLQSKLYKNKGTKTRDQNHVESIELALPLYQHLASFRLNTRGFIESYESEDLSDLVPK